MTSPGRSPRNRSLERGIAILRAFRPGTELLGNGDIAERTGLPPASISRLTQTLVAAGWLEHDVRQRAYRLAAPVLTLGHAMHSGSSLLRVATPPMVALARRLRINVGLAVRDGEEMVYLESARFNAKGRERTIVSGHRVPVELTALGRAWLAVAPPAERTALTTQWRAKRRTRWGRLEAEIAKAAMDIASKGYCVAAWQPQVVALATPLVFARRPIHVLNVSVTSDAGPAAVARTLEQPLLRLATHLREAVAELERAGGTGHG